MTPLERIRVNAYATLILSKDKELSDVPESLREYVQAEVDKRIQEITGSAPQ